jgi:hypothetical protein
MNSDTVLGYGWDYYYSIKQENNTLVVGGQIPNFDIVQKDNVFSISKVLGQYSNDDLRQFILENGFDDFYIYLDDRRYSVTYDFNSQDDLLFFFDEFKNILDYREYYQGLLDVNPNSEIGLIGLDHMNKELDSFFENNLEVTLEEETNGTYQ